MMNNYETTEAQAGAQIGYIRVSTVDQNTERQLYGVALDRTFTDKLSGSTMERPALRECLAYCRQGDVLHVHSLDRLARNMRHLLEIVDGLEEKGVTLKIHKEGWTLGRDATATDRLVVQMLASIAEFERRMMLERQREGIARAKARGAYKGRRATDPAKVAQVVELLDAGIHKEKIAEMVGVSRSVVYKVNRERVAA